MWAPPCSREIGRCSSFGNFCSFFLAFFARSSHQRQKSSLSLPPFLCNTSVQGSSLCRALSALLLASKQKMLSENPTMMRCESGHSALIVGVWFVLAFEPIL